jgi:hypothetical protein
LVRRALAAVCSALVMAVSLAACGDQATPTWQAGQGPQAKEPKIATQSTPHADRGGSDCQGFPADNIWRADVSKLPVHKSSGAYVNSIGAGVGMHPDFGSGLWEGAPIGIPITAVPPGQATSKVTFQYGRESTSYLSTVPTYPFTHTTTPHTDRCGAPGPRRMCESDDGILRGVGAREGGGVGAGRAGGPGRGVVKRHNLSPTPEATIHTTGHGRGARTFSKQSTCQLSNGAR